MSEYSRESEISMLEELYGKDSTQLQARLTWQAQRRYIKVAAAAFTLETESSHDPLIMVARERVHGSAKQLFLAFNGLTAAVIHKYPRRNTALQIIADNVAKLDNEQSAQFNALDPTRPEPLDGSSPDEMVEQLTVVAQSLYHGDLSPASIMTFHTLTIVNASWLLQSYELMGGAQETDS